MRKNFGSLISWQSEKGNAKPIASAPPFPHYAPASLTEKNYTAKFQKSQTMINPKAV
jgi:hypothetical protein